MKETFPGEARVALTPASAAQQQKLGHDCFIEAGAGAAAQFSDADYEAAGVTICATAADLISSVDVIAKVRPPTDGEVDQLGKGQTLISFFYPGSNDELLAQAAEAGSLTI